MERLGGPLTVIRTAAHPPRCRGSRAPATPSRRELVRLVLAAAAVAAAPGRALGAVAREFEVVLANGRIADGQTVVRVTRDDTVEIRWRSDRPLTLHLHGYDVELAVGSDAAAVMRFHARATGRFPVEVHEPSGRHRVVMHVEVHPR
jgi:hypothetical protein